MKKKQLLIGGGIAVILLLLFGVWNLWFSATKVAFINYQVISLGQISKANDNSLLSEAAGLSYIPSKIPSHAENGKSIIPSMVIIERYLFMLFSAYKSRSNSHRHGSRL